MPTLATIGGNLDISEWIGLANLSLPKLTQVDQFELYYTPNLTTLDITNLDTVSSFIIINSPVLETMHHNGLSNFTGNPRTYLHTLQISSTNLESVDSIFAHPFNLSGVPTSLAFVGFMDMPKLKNVTFGITGADWVRLGGGGDTVITFGGTDSPTLNYTTIEIHTGIAGFERHADTTSISIAELDSSTGNNYTDPLLLPFDQLGTVTIDTDTLHYVRNVPQAVSWTDFELSLNSKAFNMTSQFEADGTTQTWWWPEKDIQSIDIYYGNFTEGFL